MTTNRCVLASIAILAVAVVPARPTRACSRVDPSLEQEVAFSDAIFTGIVLQVVPSAAPGYVKVSFQR